MKFSSQWIHFPKQIGNTVDQGRSAEPTVQVEGHAPYKALS